MPSLHHRPCHLCPASCGLTLEVEGDQLLSVKNDPADPFSQGYCCPKGLAIGELHDDPDRLRRPLVRKGGVLVEVSWEEACRAAAEGLAGVVKRHGKHGLATYIGNPTVHHFGALLGSELWRQLLPTKNRYTANSQDVNPHLLVNFLTFGMQMAQPVPDLDRVRFLLVVGANPVVSNGSLMTAPGMPSRLREIQGRGGKVVVLDPRRTETAKLASEHHFVWPDRDGLLLLSLAHVILREGLQDAAFLERWARPGVLPALEAALEPFDPVAVSGRVGPDLDAETITRLALELAGEERSAVYARLGPSNAAHGGLTIWAATLLNALTGNLDRIGGSMFPEGLGSWIFTLPNGRGSYDRYRSPQGAREVGGEYPCHVLADQIERGQRDPQAEQAVFGLVTFAGNPVLSVPNEPRLRRAIEALEFRVAIDIYRSETAQLADVVLPPRSPLYEPFFDTVSTHFAVADAGRYAPPALSPPPPDQPSEYEIVSRLAREVVAKTQGFAGKVRARLMAEGFDPKRVVGPTIRFGPRGAGISARGQTQARLERHPHGLEPQPLEPGRLERRVFTADRKLNLFPAAIREDLPRLVELLAAEPPTQELFLIGRRQLKSNNSWLHNLPKLRRGNHRCTLLVNPSDAARAGVGEGRARLSSRVGELEVEVELSEDMAPGVVSLPHGWGHKRNGGQLASGDPGVNVNALTDDEAFDPLTGNSALNGVPVRLEPLAS